MLPLGMGRIHDNVAVAVACLGGPDATATLLEVSPEEVQIWLRGVGTPSFPQIARMAQTLQVHPTSFQYGDLQSVLDAQTPN